MYSILIELRIELRTFSAQHLSEEKVLAKRDNQLHLYDVSDAQIVFE